MPDVWGFEFEQQIHYFSTTKARPHQPELASTAVPLPVTHEKDGMTTGVAPWEFSVKAHHGQGNNQPLKVLQLHAKLRTQLLPAAHGVSSCLSHYLAETQVLAETVNDTFLFYVATRLQL